MLSIRPAEGLHPEDLVASYGSDGYRWRFFLIDVDPNSLTYFVERIGGDSKNSLTATPHDKTSSLTITEIP